MLLIVNFNEFIIVLDYKTASNPIIRYNKEKKRGKRRKKSLVFLSMCLMRARVIVEDSSGRLKICHKYVPPLFNVFICSSRRVYPDEKFLKNVNIAIHSKTFNLK